MRTGEGYAYTARSAVLAVEATLGSEPLGATTVARAFGPEPSFQAGAASSPWPSEKDKILQAALECR